MSEGLLRPLVIERFAGCGSRLLPLDYQITSAQRSKDYYACRHGEGQNEHNDDQPSAPVQIVSCLQDACRPGGNHAKQDKRQGYAWRGEIVRHQSEFLAAPAPGLPANLTVQRCSRTRSSRSYRYDGRRS